MYALHIQTRLLYYRQTFNINRTLVGNKIVDLSDVVEASPEGAAQTIYLFSTLHLSSMGWAKTTSMWNEKNLILGFWYVLN